MVDLFRQQLDELMGKERNVPLNDRYRKKEHFDDPDVLEIHNAPRNLKKLGLQILPRLLLPS